MMNKKFGLIGEREKTFTRKCLEWALDAGADQVRVSTLCSEETSISSRDGQIDEINSDAEISFNLSLCVNGRRGTLNAHRMDDSVKKMIEKGIERIRLLAPEMAKILPPADKKATGFIRGDELDTDDPEFFRIGMDKKLSIAKQMAATPLPSGDRWNVISVENEYSDDVLDLYMIDSEGFEGRNLCTDFAFSSDVTIIDNKGNRYSGSDRNFAICLKELKYEGSVARAVENAAAKLDPVTFPSGKYDIVVDRLCGNRLLGGILNALDGFHVQQHYSFLGDSLGKQLFPEQLDIIDKPLEKHRRGSAPFDSDGVAAHTLPLIEQGVVKTFLCDTITASKTGFPVTVSSPVRPCIGPFICNNCKKQITLDDILKLVGNGLYIKDFNGGNSSEATGEFSFGVEGFIIENGKVTRPFKEALMTGNLLELWKNVVAAGSDFKECLSSEIPTLAFRNVNVNI